MEEEGGKYLTSKEIVYNLVHKFLKSLLAYLLNLFISIQDKEIELRNNKGKNSKG